MKFAIIGTGGVGGYFGARLHEAGEDVVFLARGQHLRALRENGLQLHSIDGDYHATTVSAHDQFPDMGTVDVVLVATKAWQVPEIAPDLQALLHKDTFVVPLQNGVEAADQLAKALGNECVVGGLCGVMAFIEAPGVIRHAAIEPFISFGERDGQRSERVQALDAVLSKCHAVQSKPTEDIAKAVWEKFLFISAFSGVGGVTRMPIGVLRSVPETRKLLDATLREVLALAQARGLGLDEQSIERAWKTFDALPSGGTASMQRDVMEGHPSELETQTGAIVRLAQKAKVSVPVNQFIYQSLRPTELQARGELEV